MTIRNSIFTVTVAVLSGLAAVPALADHGKDFLLLETDDLPGPGKVYAIGSVDTLRAEDGERSTEITPGLIIGLGNRFALEPHFHLAKESGDRFRYHATALGLRYRIGNLGRSEWRFALSLEAEKLRHRHDEENHDEVENDDHAEDGLITPQHTGHDHDDEDASHGEHTQGTFRLIFARTFPRALVAINLIADRELTSGGERSYAVGTGILTPLANGDQVGLETIVRLPLRDGIEILPSYSRRLGANTNLKFGVGVFHARATTSGTFHLRLVQRF